MILPRASGVAGYIVCTMNVCEFSRRELRLPPVPNHPFGGRETHTPFCPPPPHTPRNIYIIDRTTSLRRSCTLYLRPLRERPGAKLMAPTLQDLRAQLARLDVRTYE